MSAVKKRRTQAERREASINLILEAATKLIAERGYDRFSLQDVGREAGCSYELINHYFDNKEGLLSAVAKHIHEEAKVLEDQLPRTSDAFENLASMISFVMELKARNPIMFRAYARLASEAPFHESLLDLFVARRRYILAFFAQGVKEGQDSGLFRGDLDPFVVAGFIWEFLRGHTDAEMLAHTQVGPATTVIPTPASDFLTILSFALVRTDIASTQTVAGKQRSQAAPAKKTRQIKQ